MAVSEVHSDAEVLSSAVTQTCDTPSGQQPLSTQRERPYPVSSFTSLRSPSSPSNSKHPPPQTQNNQRGDFVQLVLSTGDITSCMKRNKTFVLNTSHLWLHYEQTNKTTNRKESLITGACWLNVSTPSNSTVKLGFVRQTCSSVNYLSVWVQVNESFNYIDTRTGCEDFLSPLLYEYLGLGNWVRFGLVIQDPLSSYVVQLNVTGVARLQNTQLHVSSDIGTVCVSVCLLVCLCLSMLVTIDSHGHPLVLLCLQCLSYCHLFFSFARADSLLK